MADVPSPGNGASHRARSIITVCGVGATVSGAASFALFEPEPASALAVVAGCIMLRIATRLDGAA